MAASARGEAASLPTLLPTMVACASARRVHRYYADSEDAYDMRKYFPNAKRQKGDGSGAVLPTPPPSDPDALSEGVAELAVADDATGGMQTPAGKKQPPNTLEGEHDV